MTTGDGARCGCCSKVSSGSSLTGVLGDEIGVAIGIRDGGFLGFEEDANGA